MSPLQRTVLGWITVVAVVFAILTHLLVMGVAIALVSATQLRNDLAELSFNGLPPLGAFFFYFRLTSIPVSVNLLTYVWFCIIIFAACFIAAFRSRGGLLPSLRKLTRVGRITSSSNWLVAMPLVSSGLLVIVITVTGLLSAAGVSSGVLCKAGVDCPPTAKIFASLANAPIGEELAFRILTPLGLVVPIRVGWRWLSTGHYSSTTAKRTSLTARFLFLVSLSLLSPEKAKAKVGYPNVGSNGWHGIHWLEWTFVVVSSVSFGLAHVQPGGGTDWGQGKVVTAAISGAVLAVVYISYGAYANVLLHWFFDFYVEVLALGLPVSGGPLDLFARLVIVLGTIATGIVSITVGVVWVGKRIGGRISPTAYKPPETQSYSTK